MKSEGKGNKVEMHEIVPCPVTSAPYYKGGNRVRFRGQGAVARKGGAVSFKKGKRSNSKFGIEQRNSSQIHLNLTGYWLPAQIWNMYIGIWY